MGKDGSGQAATRSSALAFSLTKNFDFQSFWNPLEYKCFLITEFPVLLYGRNGHSWDKLLISTELIFVFLLVD